MKNLVLFLSLSFLFSVTCFSQNENNPYLSKMIKEMSPEKAIFLPIFLSKYTPEELAKLDHSKIESLLGEDFNQFIADSGVKYRQLLDDPKNNIKQVMTPEILVSLKRIGTPKTSPDGKKILFTITNPNISENKSNTDIFIMEINGSNLINLTSNSPKSDFDPIWSPDGKTIAFLSARNGESQIFTMNIDGSNVLKITDVPTGASNLLYSPDGKYFSYTADVKLDKSPVDKYPAYPNINVRIYESLPVRHWDEWTDESYSHLFIIPAAGGNPLDIMPAERFDTPLKPNGEVNEIAWSPDSKEIAYTCKKEIDFVHSTNSDIYIYSFKDSTTRNITKGMPGYDKDPLYSPDGNWIAFHSMQRAGFEADRIRLMLFNRKSGEITELSKTLDQWVGSTVWSKDSKSLFFSAEDGPVVQLYNINLSDGKWKILTTGKHNCDGGLDLTPDGKTLVFGRRNMMVPFELFSMKTDGSDMEQLSHQNDIVLRQLQPIAFKERWISSKDGKKVHTWVIYPPGFDSTKTYPMITYCQGGPQSTISQSFSYRWNLYTFASKGYIIVAPNRRGMPGFGQAWNDAISLDWGGGAMNDILAATDELAKEKYVKKDGIAAIGASAGGYAVFWLEGNHNKRFSAFVSHCGVFNVESKYGSTEELWFPNWEFGGPYWEAKNKPNFDKNSPHRFADKWDTPILISTGEKDFRVPFTQSLEAFTVAQVKKIPSKLIVFPTQNHWILKLQEQIVWYKEVFDFLDKYCKK